MKYILLLFFHLVCFPWIVGAWTPGIADWKAWDFRLAGKKVGIVANQTAVVEGMHTVDFLQAHGVEVVRIFCPEHGFRGEADAGEKVGNYRDEQTGLTVISLYGKKKKPLPADLDGIEVMVFDIQDVGVRFYTYLSTLHYVLEACAENHISVVVMDRPNPNAFYVDGPVMESECQSFVGIHPVPVVYGMTIGEYARMINGEGWLKEGIKCNLVVIKCRGWNREDVVALPVRPSPNLPNSVSVLLYPSVCLFEGTVVSEGRGTYTPFQVFGHPALKNMSYTFTPVSIPGMSNSPKCIGQKCYGMDLREMAMVIKETKRLHLEWLLIAYRNYTGTESFFTSFFEKLAGTVQLRKDIEAGKTERQIRESWQPSLRKFCKIREKYLIY